jgi:transposase
MSMSVKKKRVAGRPGRPSKYGPEFQRDAVAMVLDQGRSVGDVARSLGVNDGTLSNWVSKERVARASGADLGADERVELSDLRRQVGELRMERDLLKRSLAFWVKESTQ